MSIPKFFKSGWNQGLLILGIAGLLFFIYSHPRHFPDSVASQRIESHQAGDIAKSYLARIGYEPFESEARNQFIRDNKMSLQLQHQLGRHEYNRYYTSGEGEKLPVMQWSVQHDNLRDLVIGGSGENASWDINMGVTLSPGGRVIGFRSDKPDSLFTRFNPESFHGSISRLAYAAAGLSYQHDSLRLRNDRDIPVPDEPAVADDYTYAHDLANAPTEMPHGGLSVSDSVPASDSYAVSADTVLIRDTDIQVDIPTDVLRSLAVNTNEELLDKVTFDLDRERHPEALSYNADLDRFTIGRDMLEKMAEAHLNETNWNPEEFRIDSMFVIPGRSARQARLLYNTSEPILDHTIRLNMDISVSGQLLRLMYEPRPDNPREEAAGEKLWSNISGIGYLLTGLIAFIVFIRRFTLRLIDSKSALIDTLLGALIVSSVVMISAFNDIFQYGVGDMKVIIGMLIGTFFMAAIGGVLFFILSSTSVSISYGVMPEKIRTLNLARSGYMFNTPIGKAVLQGLLVSGVILGIYALYLSAFAHVVYQYDNNTPFTTYFMFGKSLSGLVNSLLVAIFLTYSLYLILGSMVYGQKHRVFWFFLVTITIWVLSFPLNPGLASPYLSVMSAAIIGAVISIIYLRYDALTVVTAIFAAGFLISVYENYLMQAPNWQAETSIGAMILLGMVATGVAGLYSRKSGDELPSFVPAYIFEHANRQRMQRELEIARQVQLSFLPDKTPEFGSIDMAANCRAASEVGGDYYDFIKLDDHRMAVVIGDVSGKGIQAAFYMTLVKGFIQSLCYNTREPAAFLSKLNFLFCKNVNRGTFVSLIFGIIDTLDNTFTFARAGHNPIIYSSLSNGKPVMLNTTGLAIGMVSDERFEQNIEVQKIHLKKGDTLVLYTDGYSEAMDPAKNLYGEEKLMSIIHKNHVSGANELLEAINKDVNRFAGFADQHDDMTMLVIRYTGGEVAREAGLAKEKLQEVE